jgi:hypothetical protein
MAVALQQSLLPGLIDQPTAYDPDYDQFEHALLGELGFKVLKDEPSYDVASRNAALLYMPCCPRELYPAVLVSRSVVVQAVAELARPGTHVQPPGCSPPVSLVQCQTICAVSSIQTGTYAVSSMHDALNAARGAAF